MIRCAGAILILDDGKLVVQRRDSMAPISPDKLNLFGGHFEEHETPHQALIRELGEETSLPIKELKFKFLMERPLCSHGQTSIYLAHIKSSHFKVFEGRGAEVYDIEELLRRQDLDLDARKILEEYQKERQWH